MKSKNHKWALFHLDRITLEGRPYINRWRIVQTPWFALYLHHILSSDDLARGLHDHPWDFLSLILSGGYWEITPEGRTWRGPGSVVRHKAEDYHGVECTRPAWTLVWCGRRRRGWGFLPIPRWEAALTPGVFRLLHRGDIIGFLYAPEGRRGWVARKWTTTGVKTPWSETDFNAAAGFVEEGRPADRSALREFIATRLFRERL